MSTKSPDYPNPLLKGLSLSRDLPLVNPRETTNREYVGVPNKGGVLIYNTSDVVTLYTI